VVGQPTVGNSARQVSAVTVVTTLLTAATILRLGNNTSIVDTNLQLVTTRQLQEIIN
jgi:hypothetical protein